MSKKNKCKQISKQAQDIKNNAYQPAIQNLISGFYRNTADNNYYTTIARLPDYWLTNDPISIARLIEKHALARAIIYTPVLDAFQTLPKIKTDLIDDKETSRITQALQDKISSIFDFFAGVRAYGTAYLIINTIGSKNQNFHIKDTTKKLTVDELQNCIDIEFIIATGFEMYDLNARFKGVFDPRIREEDNNTLNEEVPYNYLGVRKYHKSRVYVLHNNNPTNIVKSILRTGGTSTLEPLITAFNQLTSTEELSQELLKEAKTDVVSMAGLTTAQASDTSGNNIEYTLKQKMEMKNSHSVLVLDKDTTEYTQKQLNLSYLEGLLAHFQANVIKLSGIPPKRLVGVHTAGFSDADKTVEEYYNRTLKGLQEWGRVILKDVIELFLIKEFGFVPNDLSLEFQSLDVLNEAEKSQIQTVKLQNIMKLLEIGLKNEKMVELINAENIFASPIDKSDLNSTQ